MENLGDYLKRHREALNRSLEDLHTETRISTEHLEYLENNNFTFLPETYVRAYLKNYAEALDLDAAQVMQFFTEIQEAEKQKQEEAKIKSEFDAKIAPIRSQLLEWVLGVGAIVLVACIIIVYLQYRSHIYASSTDLIKLTPKSTDLAVDEPVFVQPVSDSLETSFEFQIKSMDRVWILFADSTQNLTRYRLAAGQNLNCIAKNNFEILVKNSSSLRISLNGQDIEKVVPFGENIRLTFEKQNESKNK